MAIYKGRISVSFANGIAVLTLALLGGAYWLQFRRPEPLWVILLITFTTIERLYETFYTSREQSKNSAGGDIALVLVVVSYITVAYGSFYSFYLFTHRIYSLKIILSGLALYVLSLLLRWWAIFSAGDQWGIHSVELQRKNMSRRLIRVGPYAYLRHPYYLGVCMEIISLPLMMSNSWMLIIAILSVCPIEVYRGHLEERLLLKFFGWPYLKYQHERGGFFPIKKMDNFDRRKVFSSIGSPDRRKRST